MSDALSGLPVALVLTQWVYRPSGLGNILSATSRPVLSEPAAHDGPYLGHFLLGTFQQLADSPDRRRRVISRVNICQRIDRRSYLPVLGTLRHRRSIFVTASLVFSRVSVFCPSTPLGTSVPQIRWFVPLGKFLATPLPETKLDDQAIFNCHREYGVECFQS